MVTKILGAIWPLVIFPFIIWLNLIGHLNFGAGDKDILLAVPMLIYSVVYVVCYFILIRRKQKTYFAVITSSLVSFMFLILITLIFSKFMGVGG